MGMDFVDITGLEEIDSRWSLAMGCSHGWIRQRNAIIEIEQRWHQCKYAITFLSLRFTNDKKQVDIYYRSKFLNSEFSCRMSLPWLRGTYYHNLWQLNEASHAWSEAKSFPFRAHQNIRWKHPSYQCIYPSVRNATKHYDFMERDCSPSPPQFPCFAHTDHDVVISPEYKTQESCFN